MVALPEAELVGAQTPRVLVVPDGMDHPRWPEVREFLRRAGIDLFPWQLEILRVSLMVRPDGLWAAFNIGVCCPRQNGKNEILEVRELVGACVLGEPLQVHSAHLADTSGEAFRRMDERIDQSAFLNEQMRHVWRANGKEAIDFRNGARIRYRTRTRGGGRGFSAGVVVLDEAMYLPEESETAIFYVLTAQPNPQVWYTGSAVDQQTMDNGVCFTRVRNRALAGDNDRLAWFEWSLDADTPELAPQGYQPDLLAETNPSYGLRITPEYLLAEHDALGDTRGYACERYGIGDWPDTNPDSGPIKSAAWAELHDPESEIFAPIALGWDVSPERHGSILAAGMNADELIHVEVVDSRQGTRWMPERIVHLARHHSPVIIVCDERGPGASLIAEVAGALELEGYELQLVSAAENAQACQMLVDKVEESAIRHLGDPRLSNAIRAAGTRPLGDSWAWARRTSAANISPLVAATLAVWALANSTKLVGPMVIY